MVQQQQEAEAVLKPPPPAPAAMVFAWDPELTKKSATVGARVDSSKQPQPGMSPKKQAPPTRLLSVPPPPGRAAAAARRLSSSRARAVRPEDDPFLAAYLACTKSARNENAKKGRSSSSRRFTWAALGLSCKSSSGAVEQSMVKVAKRPELNPRDD